MDSITYERTCMRTNLKSCQRFDLNNRFSKKLIYDEYVDKKK